MPNELTNLIHDPACFLRETLESRMTDVGIKNIVRMELFLWDLEIYLQFQRVLGDRLVLKGGAAVQFYLPIASQRTSVDIDMLFYGTPEEMRKAITLVEARFPHDNDLFIFALHIPKQPKTKLPLFTYYLQVPSVCSVKEVRGAAEGQQRIKAEFIIAGEKAPVYLAKGDRIFAMDSSQTYQVLPLNQLFADKLTTLGPETIGIQDERMDEQIKQLYDIYFMLFYNNYSLDYNQIREYYTRRAESEAQDRRITYDAAMIFADVQHQLNRLRLLDDGSKESEKLWKYILDFISLYAGKSAVRTRSGWAIIGETLRFLFQIIMDESLNTRTMVQALQLDDELKFNKYSGLEKGLKLRSSQERFIQQYGHLTGLETKILKGKSLNRIFWSVVTPNNLNELNGFVFSLTKDNMEDK